MKREGFAYMFLIVSKKVIVINKVTGKWFVVNLKELRNG